MPADGFQFSNPLFLRAGRLLGFRMRALVRVFMSLKSGAGVFDLLECLLFRDAKVFNLATEQSQRFCALIEFTFGLSPGRFGGYLCLLLRVQRGFNAGHDADLCLLRHAQLIDFSVEGLNLFGATLGGSIQITS